jgi:hypothetical protein
VNKKLGIAAAVLAALIGVGAAIRFAPPSAFLTPVPPPRAISQEEAQKKLAVLQDILKSRNDNDKRLDTEFNDLDPDTRELFRKTYREIPPEARNQRGTIVFLLARNLHTPEDWNFLKEVVSEPPCLSLSDCAKQGKGGDIGDEVTMAYPQLVALKMARENLEKAERPNRAMALAEVRGIVGAAKASKSQTVVKMAERIANEIIPKDE